MSWKDISSNEVAYRDIIEDVRHVRKVSDFVAMTLDESCEDRNPVAKLEYKNALLTTTLASLIEMLYERRLLDVKDIEILVNTGRYEIEGKI